MAYARYFIGYYVAVLWAVLRALPVRLFVRLSACPAPAGDLLDSNIKKTQQTQRWSKRFSGQK